MRSRTRTRKRRRPNLAQPFSQQTVQLEQASGPQSQSAESIHRAQEAPRSLSSRDVLQLQRTLGNQATGRLLTQYIHNTTPTLFTNMALAKQEPLQHNAFRRNMSVQLSGHLLRQSIQRVPLNTPNIVKLRNLLRSDSENEAISLMGTLSDSEKDAVLRSREFQELAVGAFGNAEMYRAMMATNHNLYQSLVWMFDEGTDWGKVKAVIRRNSEPADKAVVRSDNWMKKKFVKICNDEEMAEAVDLLGGTLTQKLSWMKAEGSNWRLVKAKLEAARAADASQLIDLYPNNEIRAFLVSVCNDEEMAEAVEIMGGHLFQRLWWMAKEGSNWNLVKAKINATRDNAQRVAVYNYDFLKNFFVDVCNDEEMAEAVDLLGGTLTQKLAWMKAEGSNWRLVKAKLEAARAADASQLIALYPNNEIRAFLASVCNDEEMAEAVEIMGGHLFQRLWWMAIEGSNWNLVKAKITATRSNAQRVTVYNYNFLKNFFVKICNDREMAEAVKLLGGTLSQKLVWLIAEDVSAEHYYRIIQETPVAELPRVSRDIRKQIKKGVSASEYSRIAQMLDQGLLAWGNVDETYEEKIYNQTSAGTYELETYSGDTEYDIEYRRDQLRIIVRIKLTGVATTPALRNTWLTGIRTQWNNQFHIEGPRRLKVVFQPSFSSRNQHHTVKVHTNRPRADAGNWGLNTNGRTAAHEFGHMVGNEDEYFRTAADFRRLVGRAPTAAEQDVSGGFTEGTSLMGSSQAGSVKLRHFVRFLNWLNSNRLPGEALYRLVPGP